MVSTVGHDPLLVSFVVNVELVSIWVLVPGAGLSLGGTCTVEAWELGCLLLSDHWGSASKVLKSKVWIHLRNDINTLGSLHEQCFIVHTSVAKDHVSMVF